ncbi:response regulator transcription factor [Paenibacillus sp. NFR01]|uniref:response regulator transcription factor n=1 Tax=Paenibacillus sp. NFR01 TaxID=1566279 RepID=UPI0008BCAB4F|nr:response regulator transcription factor [Paenibacillus sp. NFR01]SET32594.1 two-component system, OmpR family, copper resistance phosphate regulon response regulator CusR [Paenibacillus sp. NFR01]
MNETVIGYATGYAGQSEEDRRGTAEFPVKQYLAELGLNLLYCDSMTKLQELLLSSEPALLLAALPVGANWEGWPLISDIRERGIVLPVMVVAFTGSPEDAAGAFAAGSNEYMPLPLHGGEFKARVANLLHLSGRRSAGTPLRVDGLIFDPGRRHVSRDGVEISMTPKEYELLYYLARHTGKICSREEILRHVWGYHFHVGTNVVDVYIRHIRQKVDRGKRKKLISTVRGSGYVLRAPDDGAAE